MFTPKQMKEIFKEFSKTLNNSNKDEFYGTERENWEGFTNQFIHWYNSNVKKFDEKFNKDHKM